MPDETPVMPDETHRHAPTTRPIDEEATRRLLRVAGPEDDPESDLIGPGQHVDHYQIIRPIGQGGMGQVYLARDTKLRRRVALKLIRAEYLDDATVERFLFEARATARFSHPHIVSIYGVGEHAGMPYVALEYVEGRTLFQLIREQPLSAREALMVGLAIAEALAEAHGHGILHRDLKPANVMVADRDGRVRVLDFGLAQQIQQGDLEHAATYVAGAEMIELYGSSCGTPAYMAPEQWRGEQCSGATDVWAFGVLMHELLSGRRPYQEDVTVELAAAVCGPNTVLLPAELEALSEPLREILQRCLSKDDAPRPTATELVSTLQHELEDAAAGPSPGVLRGLQPFGVKDAGRFAGRDDELAQVVTLLEDSPVVAVVGLPGVGKSSFLRAAVVARLESSDGWLVLDGLGGGRPFDALQEAVRGAALGEAVGRGAVGRAAVGRGAAGEASGMATGEETRADVSGFSDIDREAPGVEVAAAAPRTPAELVADIRALAATGSRRVLIVVDQLEQLFSRDCDADQRQQLLQTVFSTAASTGSPIRVLVALRRDRFGLIDALPDLREVLSRAVTLEPLCGDALVRAIEPMVDAGSEAWFRSAAAEAGESAAALSLVQLAALAAQRRGGLDGEHAAAAAGDLRGALQEHAQATVDRMAAAEHDTACRLLLRLATPSQGDGKTRAELCDGLAADADDIVEVLIRDRLVSVRIAASDAGELRGALLELSHASLRKWPTLARLIQAHEDQQLALAELTAAAERWQQAGRAVELLWSRPRRRAALTRFGAMPLTSEVEQFLETTAPEGSGQPRWLVPAALGLVALVAFALLWSSLASTPAGEGSSARSPSSALSPSSAQSGASGRSPMGSARSPYRAAEVELSHAEPTSRPSSEPSAPPRASARVKAAPLRRRPIRKSTASDPYGSRH